MPVLLAGRRSVLSGVLAVLAGCQVAPTPVVPQPAPTLTLGPNRIGYILLAAPISPVSSGYFQTVVNRYVDQGAQQVYVAMNSPGGVVRSAEAMIAFMDRVHNDRGVSFLTHNVGLVASAACYVFLAGQRRLCNARGNFLFHEAGLQANGVLTGQVLQEASAQLQQHEKLFLSMLKARTHLTEGEASSFVHRTVILSADEAQRDGVTDGTEEFMPPKDVVIAAIATKAKPGTPARPVGPPAFNG